jgi:hypothetical protein
VVCNCKINKENKNLRVVADRIVSKETGKEKPVLPGVARVVEEWWHSTKLKDASALKGSDCVIRSAVWVVPNHQK